MNNGDDQGKKLFPKMSRYVRVFFPVIASRPHRGLIVGVKKTHQKKESSTSSAKGAVGYTLVLLKYNQQLPYM
jgi:hypothetical protein